MFKRISLLAVFLCLPFISAKADSKSVIQPVQYLNYYQGEASGLTSVNVNGDEYFYGDFASGGSVPSGTIYRISKKDLSYELVTYFSTASPVGTHPTGDLLQVGDSIYGVNAYGPNVTGGSRIFKINIANPSEQSVIFVPNYSQSGLLLGRLTAVQTASDIYIYGAMYDAQAQSAYYRVKTDGTGFEEIFSLPRGANNWVPTLSKLEVVTINGQQQQQLIGAYNSPSTDAQNGSITIFKMNLDGSNVSTIAQFQGTNGWSIRQLVLDQNQNVYDVCTVGPNSNGFAFRVSLNDNNVTILHQFGENSSFPTDGITESNGILYGVAQNGGSYSSGAVWQMNVDGSNYQLVGSFNASKTDLSGWNAKPVVVSADRTEIMGIAQTGDGLNSAVYSVPLQ